MSAPHNSVIAKLAKTELAALGFSQQGRSRVWLADNQSWLNVVEFTPDRWTKGVSLMNAAHWLWAGTGILMLHEAISSRQHLVFETSEQFTAAVAGIVHEAACTARDLQERFSSIDRTATFLVDRARSSPDRMMPSWWGYQAGIAAGLCGDYSTAREFLNGITDERVIGFARPLAAILGKPECFIPECFISEVGNLLRRQRHALGLPRLDRPVLSDDSRHG